MKRVRWKADMDTGINTIFSGQRTWAVDTVGRVIVPNDYIMTSPKPLHLGILIFSSPWFKIIWLGWRWWTFNRGFIRSENLSSHSLGVLLMLLCGVSFTWKRLLSDHSAIRLRSECCSVLFSSSLHRNSGAQPAWPSRSRSPLNWI